MKIDLGYWAEQDICNAIRRKITCGRCSASTLLLWNEEQIGERPKGSSSATIITDSEGKEDDVYYLVRCSFFKFNVTDPEHIIHCEGFKSNSD